MNWVGAFNLISNGRGVGKIFLLTVSLNKMEFVLTDREEKRLSTREPLVNENMLVV